MNRLVILMLVCLVISSCGTRKGVITTKKNSKRKTEVVVKPKTEVVVKPKTTSEPKRTPKTSTPKTSASLNSTETYIANYNAIAMEEMRKYKIPASITLAQGILESGSGKGRLSVEANNHFGIKCHGWKGKKIYHDDDTSQECFRKYDHAETSFEDHSTFLTSRSRYAKLFKLKRDDYKGWAKGLRAAGYATDRRYPEKLISLIERYELDVYDDIVLGNKTEIREAPKSDMSLSHQVVKGDTLYSLSKKYNTTVDVLKRLNGLRNNDLSLGQILIIKSN